MLRTAKLGDCIAQMPSLNIGHIIALQQTPKYPAKQVARNNSSTFGQCCYFLVFPKLQALESNPAFPCEWTTRNADIIPFSRASE